MSAVTANFVPLWPLRRLGEPLPLVARVIRIANLFRHNDLTT
ncbi:MAG: hypothetical protein ACM3NQ_06440 [Bacteroidales bacterium]